MEYGAPHHRHVVLTKTFDRYARWIGIGLKKSSYFSYESISLICTGRNTKPILMDSNLGSVRRNADVLIHIKTTFTTKG